jgi:ABC-type nickel/cobalt efflux system permease component RcnA
MTENIPVGWAYLPVAFVLGGLHALEPGHGKVLASVFLISGKHTWKDAVVLGVVTTVTHTSFIAVLAAASLWAKDEMKGPFLQASQVGAAAVLVLVGLISIWRSARALRHGHAHEHGHSHATPAPGSSGLGSVIAVGISNGMLPCPGALAALLVAFSLGQASLGLATVLTYSLGLAVSLSLLGILVLEAGRRAQAWLPSDKATLWMPLISSILVTATGLWLLLRVPSLLS